MMKRLLLGYVLCAATAALAEESPLNLSFEALDGEQAVGWEVFGSESGYLTSISDQTSQDGQRSAVIESIPGAKRSTGKSKGWRYKIPAKYAGKKITLTGYVKTADVEDGGYASLWMRLEPLQAGSFDYMADRGITGTTDWTQYEITLNEELETFTEISIGGRLVGSGKMWVDQLELLIDDVPLHEATLKTLTAAQQDTEFDQGSGIEFGDLSEQQVTDLAVLGRVWGFLKYHHPKIAAGELNWDYELFRFLPEYLQAQNIDERNLLLAEWIDRLGKLERCSRCQLTRKHAILKPDHAWFNSSEFNDELIGRLNVVYQGRVQGKQYYLDRAPFANNAVFLNEADYSDMDYPDAGFRLLALFRYWNMVQYFFPSKHLTDIPWSEILRKQIGKFVSADSELAYEKAVLNLVADGGDTHGRVSGADQWRESKGANYAPVHVRFVRGQLVVTDYYNPELQEQTGLQIGDVIERIEGQKISAIVEQLRPYYVASNNSALHRDISGDLLRSNTSSIKVTYRRHQETKQLAIPLFASEQLNRYRWYPADDDAPSFRMLDDDIGYVSLQSIEREDVEKIKQAFRDTKGIVVDIRNYPATFVVFSLSSFFYSEERAFVNWSQPDFDNPGEINMHQYVEMSADEDPYQGKLVVIVNELTQSQAEYTAMALKGGDNTTIIGSQTAGADGNVSLITFPGGMRSYISGLGVYYPDGTETQRIGIVPDIEVLPTVEGIQQGRDELLETAVALIRQSHAEAQAATQ